jgi:hypothetical protein
MEGTNPYAGVPSSPTERCSEHAANRRIWLHKASPTLSHGTFTFSCRPQPFCRPSINMWFNLSNVSAILALANLTYAAAVAEKATAIASARAPTKSRVADKQCKNTAYTRHCWGGGFSVATDYDKSWPNTGKTVNVRYPSC